MADLEMRQFGFRAARPTVGSDNKLSGRAAPFNSKTLIGTEQRGFREWINPKAFNKTIQDGDQVLLDNHDPKRPLARRSAGSLELHAGAQGLDWRAVASNTSYASDVLENVKAGNYGGCSFTFAVVEERWDENTPDGIPERELVELKCREISIVTFPAYKDTDVYARSVDIGLESRSTFWAPLMEGEIELEERADGSPKPYGDVKYADPKNGKYPIDTEAHARAAWAYINMPKNAAKYPLNGVTVSEVKSRIMAALKHFGIHISEGSNDEPLEPEERSFEFEELRLVVPIAAFDDEQWAAVQDEFRWWKQIQIQHRLYGEPDESTRDCTDEEQALLLKRHEEKMLARFESRKASFDK
jgi:HK97 family phage prohead protease